MFYIMLIPFDPYDLCPTCIMTPSLETFPQKNTLFIGKRVETTPFEET